MYWMIPRGSRATPTVTHEGFVVPDLKDWGIFWLVITNIALGIAVVACVFLVLKGFVKEIRGRDHSGVHLQVTKDGRLVAVSNSRKAIAGRRLPKKRNSSVTPFSSD